MHEKVTTFTFTKQYRLQKCKQVLKILYLKKPPPPPNKTPDNHTATSLHCIFELQSEFLGGTYRWPEVVQVVQISKSARMRQKNAPKKQKQQDRISLLTNL